MVLCCLNKKPHRLAAITGMGILGLALTPLVPAQTPDTAGEIPATLDAVMVTTNKRVENVQEIPKQVMVVSAGLLGKSGITTISELGNLIPAIGGMIDPRSSTPPLRGISSFGTTIGVQSQTGVVIDDVPQPAYSSLFRELADIQSVEVLAGPQSTLSGRNASAGLINVRTREPLDYFAAEAFFEHTSDRQQRFSAFMSAPLADTLAFSVSAFSNEWDGHLRSSTETSGNRPRRWRGLDTQGVRGKLHWQPDARFNALFSAYTMENTSFIVGDDGAYVFVDPTTISLSDTQGRTFAELYPGIPVGPYNTWTGNVADSRDKTRDHGGSLKLEYELDNGMRLMSISALTKASILRNTLIIHFDGFRAVNPNYPYNITDYITETKIQEIRLISPGGQRFDYILGAIYSDEDTIFPLQRLGVGPANWIRAFYMQSAALFARGTLHMGRRDELTLGLRYQDDKMGYRWDFLPPVETASIPDMTSTGESQYDFFSAELSWRRTLAEDISVYATAARAQSGQIYDLGYARGARSTGISPLDSQKVTNLELGLKSQWLDRRLTVNANLFQARYDNYQIRTRQLVTDPNVPIEFRLFTVGKVHTRGVELDARLHATQRLDVNLGMAWVDAIIKDFPNAQCWVRQTEAQGCVVFPGSTATGQPNLRGNQMPHAPKFKLTTAANYFIPLDNLPFDLELTGAYRWQSNVWFDYRGNPDMRQNGYGILNLSAALHDRDGRYTLTVFVNNVLDRNFYINMDDNDFWSAPAYLASYARDSFRYGGVNLRINF